MIQKIIFFFHLILLFLLTACEPSNLFDDVANTDTDEAIFYEARRQMNQQNYNRAIVLFGDLSTDFRSQRTIVATEASAYSGRCGLNFINLVETLEGLTTTTTIYGFLFNIFLNGTDDLISDCQQSETLLESIGDYTQRTVDENILMGLSSLLKVGTILSRYADIDGNGVVDAGFDHCDLVDLPDAAVREIGTGTAHAILSASAAGSDINQDVLTEITDLCALDPNLNTFCTNTDPSAYSATEVQILRTLVGSSDFGIGACTGDLLTCLCP